MVRPEQPLAVQQKLRRARSVSDFSSASGTYFAKKGAIEEFNFAKGMTVAIFAGVMSVCLAYGLAAGKPVASLAKGPLLAGGRADLWQNLPALVVVLWGGFTSNFIAVYDVDRAQSDCFRIYGDSLPQFASRAISGSPRQYDAIGKPDSGVGRFTWQASSSSPPYGECC